MVQDGHAGEPLHESRPNELRRLHDARFWIFQGLDVYKRGIENNPNSYKLWESTGELYQNRLGDFHHAADCYERASELPGAPVYLERFKAYMLADAHDYPGAYAAWKALWFRLTPAQREEKQHWKEKIEKEMRQLENKLNIPQQKRVFPN
jgi:tetratricopeptide (TPR) repeat protein